MDEIKRAMADDAGLENTDEKKITVGHLGMMLPVGTGPLDGSAPRNQSLKLKPWTAADDRALSAWRRKNPSLSPSDVVVGVLAHFVEVWGEHDFGKLTSRTKRELILTKSPTSDIFHAWTLLRIENLDEVYKVGISCEQCRKEIPFSISLEDIELTVPVSQSQDLTRVCGTLRRGFEYNGEQYREPRVRPLLWKTYVDLHKHARNDLTAVKLEVIRGAVCGFKGHDEDIIISPRVVDTLIKRDIESLSKFIEEKQYGPDLSIIIDCPHCNARIARSVIWEYDVFFSGATSSI